MKDKPRLLILSHVYPFPPECAHHQRILYTLKAAREVFDVTFLTLADTKDIQKVRRDLLALCDDVILLSSRYCRSSIVKVWHRMAGALYNLLTGLKFSNYVLGKVEFSPSRLAPLFKTGDFECVLFEYWYAANSMDVFRKRGIVSVLDMHDIQWKAYAQQVATGWGLPGFWKNRTIAKYREQEERAWQQFDGVITINLSEHEYVCSKITDSTRAFYVPMGIDMNSWPYSWQPAYPPRICYYGGMGSPHNQRDALRCYRNIMPKVWEKLPMAEFWIVGSSPSNSILSLASDRRVKITGYVKYVQEVLKTMHVVLCPWSGGQHGFRSRLIEVMALGVPVVLLRDTVYGMGMDIGQGLFAGETDQELAKACLNLLGDRKFARAHSYQARSQVEEKFSFESTYRSFVRELDSFLQQEKFERDKK